MIQWIAADSTARFPTMPPTSPSYPVTTRPHFGYCKATALGANEVEVHHPQVDRIAAQRTWALATFVWLHRAGRIRSPLNSGRAELRYLLDKFGDDDAVAHWSAQQLLVIAVEIGGRRGQGSPGWEMSTPWTVRARAY
jgi:hypothetical protein